MAGIIFSVAVTLLIFKFNTMAKSIHKGTELNNVRETWEQNERERAGGDDAISNVSDDLDEVIKEEAAEYDNDNKENRLLSGDRATINDDDNSE